MTTMLELPPGALSVALEFDYDHDHGVIGRPRNLAEDYSMRSSASTSDGTPMSLLLDHPGVPDDVDMPECPGMCVASAETLPDDRMPGETFFFDRDQTIMIFDWDDTLLPSTWLKRNDCQLGESVTPDNIMEELQPLAEVVMKVLSYAQTLGEVVIITNAEHGWIDLSCKKWFPMLHQKIMDNFNIVSARSTYEPCGVKSPCGWKAHAFETAINKFYLKPTDNLGLWSNVISIGDSPHEREALYRVAMAAYDRQQLGRTKSISFMIRPSCNQLKLQLDMLLEGLHKIVGHDDNLDLQMQLGR